MIIERCMNIPTNTVIVQNIPMRKYMYILTKMITYTNMPMKMHMYILTKMVMYTIIMKTHIPMSIPTIIIMRTGICMRITMDIMHTQVLLPFWKKSVHWT